MRRNWFWGRPTSTPADEQIEQIAFYWINLHEGEPRPLTIRILGPNRDLYFDIAGGNRIPKLGERSARSVAELREAGVGISRVLVVHDRTPAGSDLFADVLTMLDPQVALTLAPLPKPAASPSDDPGEADRVEKDLDRAKQLRREVTFRELPAGETCTQIAALAAELKCNLIIVGKQEASAEQASLDCDAVVRQAKLRRVRRHAAQSAARGGGVRLLLLAAQHRHVGSIDGLLQAVDDRLP